MVKITRTSTKYPSPTEEFLPYGNVALCFLCLSLEHRDSSLAPAWLCAGGCLCTTRASWILSRGKETFSTEFSGNCTVAALKHFSSPLDCCLHWPQLCLQQTLPFQGQTGICHGKDLTGKTQREFKRSDPQGWERNL